MRVLIIEDEERLARNIARALTERALFAADVSTDGEDGRHMAMTNPYDLIILDLMLPGIPGMKILRDLRASGATVPVLILTALDASEDVIAGLETGSDDYMTKPFEMAELVARCRALVRRSYDRPDPTIRVGPLSINTASRAVTIGGETLQLPAMEYRLLEYLALRAGQVVSKTDILEHLYDFDSERFSNVIEVYVSALRRKLDPVGKWKLIQTLRGQGYRLGEALP